MDKVIIDGVDVSGCKHYRAEIETKMPYGEYEILKDKCHYSGIEIIQNCKGNKGCIYKQLKRLEQENEELKNQYSFSTILKIDKLKSENERLKQENEQLKKLKFKSDGIELLQDANLNLHNANVKYRTALQEIRDICNKTAGTYTNKKILARINEVIGAE